VLLLAVVLLAGTRVAVAKMDGGQWSEAEKSFRALLQTPGEEEKKTEAIKAIVEDGEPRAWKLIADAVLRESEHVARVAERREKDVAALPALLAKKLSEMVQADRDEMYRLE